MPVKLQQTNFTRGEVSPQVENARQDLVGYYNALRQGYNVLIRPEGGAYRRPGLRYVAEVKDSTKETILLPFEFNITDAYVLEFGDQYIRIFKNGVPIRISAGGPPLEIVTPYGPNDLKNLHFTQSADVMYFDHPNYAPRTLSRVSDTAWTLSLLNPDPPPSFEADTDISGATITLTPAATSGSGVIFTASSAVFLEADVGRQIIFGAARAVITAFGASAGDTGSPNDHIRADIIDAFPNTDPIPAGSWLMRLSPQSALDPNKKEPVGTLVTCTTDKPTFRSADVGKFILVYGGLLKIQTFNTASSITCQLLKVLEDATATDPAAAPAGSWSLEENAWSTTRGWPHTVEFHEGRLGHAATDTQPTTFWLSDSDNYNKYGRGSLATDAIIHTITNRKINLLEWMVSFGPLIIGDADGEQTAKGKGIDEPLGGDVIPHVQRQGRGGSASVQPVVLDSSIIYLQFARKKIMEMMWSIEFEKFESHDLLILARHLTTSFQIKHHSIVYAKEPDSNLYFIRGDGIILCLTYYRQEQVAAWSTIQTDGLFKSACAIPHPNGEGSQIWCIVERVINGATKKYVEYFDEVAADLGSRAWTSLQTDSAFVYNGSATVTITGLDHLEAESVDVIADAVYVGRKTVTAGQIILDTAASIVEVGLPYTHRIKTLRPSIPNVVTRGVRRRWLTVVVDLENSYGGTINGHPILHPVAMDGTVQLFTGEYAMKNLDWTLDGSITIEGTQPYPFQVNALFGEVEFAERMSA